MSYAVQRKKDKLYLDLKKLPKKVRFSKVPVTVPTRSEAARHCWYDGLSIVRAGPRPEGDMSKYGRVVDDDVFVMHDDTCNYDIWYRADGGVRITSLFDDAAGPVSVGNWRPLDVTNVRRDVANGVANTRHVGWMRALEAMPNLSPPLPPVVATRPQVNAFDIVVDQVRSALRTSVEHSIVRSATDDVVVIHTPGVGTYQLSPPGGVWLDDITFAPDPPDDGGPF